MLLWGLGAVAAPILIHLLLRQRPRPRPWAAMAWLQAAILVAQRRYKLTNLLLLLLRCLVLALLALALARPSFSGLGQGGRLVLIVDTSASMGPLSESPGALADAIQSLSNWDGQHEQVAVVTVDARVQLHSDGAMSGLANTLSSLEAVMVPGGLDRAAEPERFARLLEWCSRDSDVLMISDFRQDDGSRLLAALGEHVRSVQRWRVGSDSDNAIIGSVQTIGSPLPGQAASLRVSATGEPGGATLAIDGSLPVPVTLEGTGSQRTVRIPPLGAGRHELELSLIDTGLSYDNRTTIPVHVREGIETLTISDRRTRIGTALDADSQRLRNISIAPGDIGVARLPPGGLVFLDQTLLTGSDTLAEWLRTGGVLWCTLSTLRDSPDLAAILGETSLATTEIPGGVVNSGTAVLDASLSRIELTSMPTWNAPEQAEVLLRSGEHGIVHALAIDSGWLVVSSIDFEDHPSLTNSGGFPLWVGSTVRELCGRLTASNEWTAGDPSPITGEVRRDGLVVDLTAGEAILLEPGLWQTGPDHRPQDVVVLPARNEGMLRPLPVDAPTNLAQALPQRRGRDWGFALLIAAFLVLLAEGALAARAGRAYGGG